MERCLNDREPHLRYLELTDNSISFSITLSRDEWDRRWSARDKGVSDKIPDEEFPGCLVAQLIKPRNQEGRSLKSFTRTARIPGRGALRRVARAAMKWVNFGDARARVLRAALRRLGDTVNAALLLLLLLPLLRPGKSRKLRSLLFI